jgi:hypothetical protein
MQPPRSPARPSVGARHARPPDPGGSDPVGAALVSAVPELLPVVGDLVEAADGPAGADALLAALADLVAVHLVAAERHAEVLARSAAALDRLLEACDEPTGPAACFFDALAPDDRARMTAWLGPAGRSAAEQLDAEAGG